MSPPQQPTNQVFCDIWNVSKTFKLVDDRPEKVEDAWKGKDCIVDLSRRPCCTYDPRSIPPWCRTKSKYILLISDAIRAADDRVFWKKRQCGGLGGSE